MPLKKGYSYRTVRDNIAQLLSEDYPYKQAEAAAFNNARRHYMARFPQSALPDYLQLPQVKRRIRKVNPVPASHIVKQRDAAARLYKKFTGHEALDEIIVDKPVLPDVMLIVGDIDGILYTTVRDGKTEKYIHQFKKTSRPLFCVSPDGKLIFILGGSYDFTERGIVDRT
ncbi:MAG: hypothetical protein ACHP7O_11650, partial [Burkholderiales bacterium]